METNDNQIQNTENNLNENNNVEIDNQLEKNNIIDNNIENNDNLKEENNINDNTNPPIEKKEENFSQYGKNINIDKDPILNKNYVIKLDDLNKFKDDILTHIYLIESKINQNISNQQELISNNSLKFTNQITVLEQKNSHLSEQFSKINFDTSKISELMNFKKKAENDLISQKVRLESSVKDFSNAIYKYDKIILDNLNVPGHIGAGAKYKNLSEYLSHNIKKMKNILDDQRYIQNKLKEHKNILIIKIMN